MVSRLHHEEAEDVFVHQRALSNHTVIWPLFLNSAGLLDSQTTTGSVFISSRETSRYLSCTSQMQPIKPFSGGAEHV